MPGTLKAVVCIPGTRNEDFKAVDLEVPTGVPCPDLQEREFIRQQLRACFSKIHAVACHVRFLDECEEHLLVGCLHCGGSRNEGAEDMR